jgi:hypothetical protein
MSSEVLIPIARRPVEQAEVEARSVMDIYDGAEWTEVDIAALRSAIESGSSIEDVAQFFCRADSVDAVAGKCEELERLTRSQLLLDAALAPPALPTEAHRIGDRSL